MTKTYLEHYEEAERFYDAAHSIGHIKWPQDQD